jgi:hypothetical protein
MSQRDMMPDSEGRGECSIVYAKKIISATMFATYAWTATVSSAHQTAIIRIGTAFFLMLGK